MTGLEIAALIKGGTALAQGIAGGIGAKQQAEAEKLRAQQAMDVATEIRERGLAGRKEYGLGPSFSNLRQLVMQDPTSDYLRQQAQRQEAGQLDALQAGGARALLGGTQAVAQSTADRLAKIADEEQRRRENKEKLKDEQIRLKDLEMQKIKDQEMQNFKEELIQEQRKKDELN